MSTLDVVTQVGGSAANFLDIGGGANADVMAAALEVINSDKNVRAIFVNIFGGITRVDEVANGILEALSRVDYPISHRVAARRDQRRGRPRDPGSASVADARRRRDDARRRSSCGRSCRGPCVSIFVDETTTVVVQGLTGGQGRFHGLRNRQYGTKVVAGVTPGKGGTDVEGIPVFDTIVRGGRERPARSRRSSWFPQARERSDPRGSRGRNQVHRVHNRGHPRSR